MPKEPPELDCSSYLTLRNQDPSTVQEIMNLESHLEASRKKIMKKVHDFIAQIQSKLVSLKAEVHDDFTMEIRDADYYRVTMFQLEGKITQLKQSISIELCNLIKEENELCRDLQFMERRVEEWNKPLANTRAVKSAANPSRSSALTHADLSEFQKFLTLSGGHTGGWDEQDHVLFLRERRKYHGKKKFLDAVECLLPDINLEEIKAHENWYQKYETLKKEQKDAIKKWRSTRQSSLDKRQDSSTDERGEGSANKSQARNYAAQRDITERIKEWKRQQLVKKAEEEERQKADLQRQSEERLRKREIQKNKKSAVNAYKTEKLNRLQSEMLTQQMKELQALEDRAKKSVLLRAFREQDQQLLEKKKMKKFQAEWREKQRLERLQNVKPAVELAVDRDPQRILQPTKTWYQHTSQQPETNQSVQALTLHTIPHLAVPSWRRGLNINNTQTL